MSEDGGTVDVLIRARLDQLERDLVAARRRLAGFDLALRRPSAAAREFDEASIGAAAALRTLANNVGILQGPLGPLAGRISFLSSGIARVGIAGLAAGLSLTGLAVVAKKSIEAFTQLEREQSTYVGVLQATNYAAGKTASDIEDMASSIRKSTLATEGSVRSASAILLTFRSISGDTFYEALKL